ncbi:MAG TPA: hypothetical protein VKC61_03770 [Pyrinomonadaceae bacterium]|nr:hypothetical protein [Pyrinomonadaceae bacterium]
MTKHIQEPVVFEMRLETHYAQPVGKLEVESLWKKPKETAYEQFPENHDRFQAFLSISRQLENTARDYKAEWKMERVRKQESPDRGLIHPPEAHLDGAYSDLLYQVGTWTSTAVAAIGLIKAMQPSLVQWLKNRGPRTLLVKIGTSEISVQGEQDIAKVVQLLEKVAPDNAEEGAAIPKARKSRVSKTKKPAASPQTKVRPSR